MSALGQRTLLVFTLVILAIVGALAAEWWLSLGPGPGILLGAGRTEPLNPHGEFIFRVTGTQSCRDCHASRKKQGPKYGLLDNDAVRSLVAKGKGAHGPGRFADCFRCHAGGRTGTERGSEGSYPGPLYPEAA